MLGTKTSSTVSYSKRKGPKEIKKYFAENESYVEELEHSARDLIVGLEDEHIFVLNIYAFNDGAKVVKQFGDKYFLDSSPFDNSKYLLNLLIRSISTGDTTVMKGTIRTINFSHVRWKKEKNEMRGAHSF